MSSALKYLKKLKLRFYRGPENMGALRIPKFVGYQTVTLTALYWLNYLINTQMTLIGRIMVLMGTLMITYCLIDPYVLPMSYLGFSLIVIYAINLIVGYIFKPRVKVEREMPDKAICGVPVPVKYNVTSTNPLPCWDVKLDAIHYPGCKFSETLVIPTISGRYDETFTTSVKFNHRGVYNIPKTFAESSFPFGLWKWGVWGKGNREVRVVPKPLHISNIQIEFLSGDNDINYFESTMGTGMEFASCREFRFGDNPRHIHWPSWARTMTPVVREMCDEGRPAISILFDNCFKVNLLTKYTDIQPGFEMSISFLAGISLYLKKQKFCVRNLIIENELETFEGNNVDDIHEEILDLCCDISDIRKVEPLKVSGYMIDRLMNTKGLIMILQNWDDSRQEAVQRLSESGMPVKVILLGHDKPANSEMCQFISYKDLMSGGVSRI